jgi:hypothetical protein
VAADDIGDRGQWLCALLLSRLCPGRTDAYFRPYFFGDKFPTSDFLVTLVGHAAHYFFVQVKSTRQGYRQEHGERRLRVNVSNHDVRRLVALPAPAYVAGIDEVQEIGYLLSMNEPRTTGLGGLPTRHPLNCENLARLWQEVHDFWSSREMSLSGSYFV